MYSLAVAQTDPAIAVWSLNERKNESSMNEALRVDSYLVRNS